jgi:hypothetical protein
MKRTWKQLPDKPRRILTLIFGMLLVISAPLIGWIPGPGGTIVFLLGIAVLATEFEWAERLRDWILVQLRIAGKYISTHRLISTIIGSMLIAGLAVLTYYSYTYII